MLFALGLAALCLMFLIRLFMFFSNGDLWARLRSVLSTRPVRSISVKCVKGHVGGISAEADKQGNDGADALATSGAELHSVDTEVASAAARRVAMACAVHTYMVEVIRARWAADSDPEVLADPAWHNENESCSLALECGHEHVCIEQRWLPGESEPG